MQGIYRIRNKLDDKRYIGSTNNFEAAWKCRQRLLQKNKHWNPWLQRAWDKYGEDNFVFEIEEEVKGDRKVLLDCEQVHLNEGFELGILYNIARKADAPPAPEIGHEVSEETRAKLCKAMTGENNPFYGKFGESHPSYGREVSKETRAKLSMALSGENHPQYGKKRPNLSKRMMGRNNPNYGKDMSGENNPFYGKHHTKEWKYKKSKQMLGEKHPQYGKRRSEETKVKIGKANARPYPAFYNIKTKEYIPAGRNLTRLCREQNLNDMALLNLKQGNTEKSHGGWRLAMEQDNSRP